MMSWGRLGQQNKDGFLVFWRRRTFATPTLHSAPPKLRGASCKLCQIMNSSLFLGNPSPSLSLTGSREVEDAWSIRGKKCIPESPPGQVNKQRTQKEILQQQRRLPKYGFTRFYIGFSTLIALCIKWSYLMCYKTPLWLCSPIWFRAFCEKLLKSAFTQF